MNIVHVIFNMRPGGMEHFLSDLVDIQSSSDDNVSVIVVNRDNDDKLMNRISSRCNVIEINRTEGSFNPWYAIKLNRILGQLTPDVVNVHCRRLMGMIVKRKKVRYVFTCHDMLEPLGFASRADYFISVSEAVAGWMKESFGVESEVINNGIQTDEIKKRCDRPLGNPIKLVTIARLDHTVKGQHILLEALASMRCLDFCLDLIGDGPSRVYIEKLAEGLGIGSRVRFMLNVERRELYGRLNQYDIFILPSLNEAFSIALAEALAASLPVIVSNLDGPMTVIDKGDYGLVFTPGDSHDLACKISEIVNNYSLAFSRARHGSEFVKLSFDITRTTARYRQFYKKIVCS
ncbi:MAG: glycosyltransferase family 4 protein [Muribaculaceae bacterium]|nr:glycosyltransferase family 4 protein [Muribaculaceae bacterium]